MPGILPHNRPNTALQHGGLALFTVMIILLIVSMIAAVGANDSMRVQHSVSNQYAQTRAFMAAERGVAVARQIIAANDDKADITAALNNWKDGQNRATRVTLLPAACDSGTCRYYDADNDLYRVKAVGTNTGNRNAFLSRALVVSIRRNTAGGEFHPFPGGGRFIGIDGLELGASSVVYCFDDTLAVGGCGSAQTPGDVDCAYQGNGGRLLGGCSSFPGKNENIIDALFAQASSAPRPDRWNNLGKNGKSSVYTTTGDLDISQLKAVKGDVTILVNGDLICNDTEFTTNGNGTLTLLVKGETHIARNSTCTINTNGHKKHFVKQGDKPAISLYAKHDIHVGRGAANLDMAIYAPQADFISNEVSLRFHGAVIARHIKLTVASNYIVVDTRLGDTVVDAGQSGGAATTLTSWWQGSTINES